ncbi:hypothetical protein INQ40_07815 [Lysobacter sp. H21R4]|uniref:hypothetical protein n=1 Tax=Lysobacter sp. H21R4 TaxID=2781021 RepID=UPI001888131F|nr:hypothetical protein [Lysobacter sp. H21R4]QOY61875.1 hypothetical protein INQ40_07815 [Lysobacter sp. H21R4]
MSTKDAGLEFPMPDDEYREVAASQRQWVREMADTLERGETLSKLDLKVATAILRGWADNLPDKQRRKAGQAPRINPSDIALEFEAMTRNPNIPTSANAAKEHLAEKYGVSVEAIRAALAKKGKAATEFMEFFEAHGAVSYKQKK